MSKIVVIEDEEAICLLYQKVLERFGHQVTATLSGEAGIQAALRIKPDLVIVDLLLPGISGSEVVTRLRNEGLFPETKLLVTTGMSSARAAAEATESCKRRFSLANSG